MKIKVCGITQIEQLLQLDNFEIDFAGMIFYKNSPRFIGEKITSKKIAAQKFALKKTGVFVNENSDVVQTQIAAYNLDAVQLHGGETPEYCKALQSSAIVIKAFRISDGDNVDAIVDDYASVCDFYLFDTHTKYEHGGTGKKFNWDLLRDNKINKNFFLSGGISLEDVEAISNFKHPYFYAVDINSKFETAPGIKNITAVKTFIRKIKEL